MKKDLALELLDYLEGFDGELELELNEEVKGIVERNIVEDLKEKDKEKLERFDITDEYFNECQIETFEREFKDYGTLEDFRNLKDEQKVEFFLEFFEGRIAVILDLDEE